MRQGQSAHWQVRENRDRPQVAWSHRWLWFLVVGIALSGTLSAVLPDAYRFGAVCLTDTTVCVTILLSVRRYRPATSTSWKLLAAAIAVDAITDALAWHYGFGTSHSSVPPYVEILTLARYPLLGMALVRLSPRRTGQTRAGGMLDAGIVACGLIALLWTFTVDPLIDATADPLRAGTLIIRPMLDLLLVVMGLRLVLISRVRTRSLLFLIAGLAMQLVALPVLAPTLVHNVAARPVIGLLPWIVSSILLGAAALHPSMSTELRDLTDSTISRTRVMVFAVLALSCPLIAMIRALTGGLGGNHVIDILFPILISALLSLFMVLRIGQLATAAQRRIAQMHVQAGRLSESLAEQLTLQDQLSFRALHDSLTGLPNRALLLERLQRALSRNGGNDSQALLILDLDGFKDVNDSYGHPVGDLLLATVAERLTGCLAADDTLARLGGDEFAALLENIPSEAAYSVANRLIHAIRAPYSIDGHEFFITASVGVLAACGASRTTSEVMRDADLALYAAKAAGKNQATVFSVGMRAAHENRTRLASALRRALNDKEFTLAYQPVVDLDSGTVRGLEALIRWTPPGGTPIPPDQFIPVAEEIGLIGEIGAWVLEQACVDAQRWYEGYGLTVAVNVSGRQLTEKNFAENLIGILRAHGVPGKAIVVEITETVLVASTAMETDLVRSHLDRLRRYGIRVAIDDFGTGYSSLSYLRNLPVDVLKIDRSFMSFEGVDDAAKQHRAFTGAILQLSESLGLETIAEGVETTAQAEILQQMNCPMAQGFLFARPMPAADIDLILSERSPATTG